MVYSWEVLLGGSLLIAAIGVGVGFVIGIRLEKKSLRKVLTERKRSQREDFKKEIETFARERDELTILMGALSDAILAVDLEGKPLFYNSRFILLFADREFTQKKPSLPEIFESPSILEAFNKALKEGKSQESSAVIQVNSREPVRHFALSVAPLRKEGGVVYGAVCVFHDVTELKRSEKIRIDFVANVSHELRTPLTSIKGFADTLQMDLRDKGLGNAEKFLGVIQKNVDRLMNLVQDLLDLSSLESSEASGSKSIQKVPVATEPLTLRVLAQLDKRVKAKKVEVHLVNEAAVVLGEESRIEQVLTNVFENALKYIPEKGQIKIHWESRQNGTYLHVADNGPGISHDHQSRLFERFYRVDPARSREQGGTGLGLAIVKHIMQRHQGNVWVVSELGKGAEFICHFP